MFYGVTLRSFYKSKMYVNLVRLHIPKCLLQECFVLFGDQVRESYDFLYGGLSHKVVSQVKEDLADFIA